KIDIRLSRGPAAIGTAVSIRAIPRLTAVLVHGDNVILDIDLGAARHRRALCLNLRGQRTSAERRRGDQQTRNRFPKHAITSLFTERRAAKCSPLSINKADAEGRRDQTVGDFFKGVKSPKHPVRVCGPFSGRTDLQSVRTSCCGRIANPSYQKCLTTLTACLASRRNYFFGAFNCSSNARTSTQKACQAFRSSSGIAFSSSGSRTGTRSLSSSQRVSFAWACWRSAGFSEAASFRRAARSAASQVRACFWRRSRSSRSGLLWTSFPAANWTAAHAAASRWASTSFASAAKASVYRRNARAYSFLNPSEA